LPYGDRVGGPGFPDLGEADQDNPVGMIRLYGVFSQSLRRKLLRWNDRRKRRKLGIGR
jgi:hypothetical protein